MPEFFRGRFTSPARKGIARRETGLPSEVKLEDGIVRETWMVQRTRKLGEQTPFSSLVIHRGANARILAQESQITHIFVYFQIEKKCIHVIILYKIYYYNNVLICEKYHWLYR